MEAKMGKVMRYTLGASLNIRHNLSSSKGPKPLYFIFFFNDTPTTEIYTLSLHDALPICRRRPRGHHVPLRIRDRPVHRPADRKSTRLNSSHANISYAVFCLKQKKNKNSEEIVSLSLRSFTNWLFFILYRYLYYFKLNS